MYNIAKCRVWSTRVVTIDVLYVHMGYGKSYTVNWGWKGNEVIESDQQIVYRYMFLLSSHGSKRSLQHIVILLNFLPAITEQSKMQAVFADPQ